MRILFPPEEIQRPYPMNYRSDDAKLFDNSIKESWPIYYEQYRNVSVNSELFVKKKIKILPISFGDVWQDARYNRPIYLAKSTIKDMFRKKVDVEETLWILDQFSTGGYYHWLTEILPRFWTARKFGLYEGNYPMFFPGYFFTKWNFGSELLKPFNVSYQTYNAGELLRIKKMHFISQSGGPLAFQSKPLIAANKKLLEYYYDKHLDSRYERIYISRNHGKKRVLLNEDEVLPILKRHGFRLVHTELLTLKEQINMFARASHLLSIHGAGLTNMVFMPRGSHVIEIRNRSQDHMVNCFLGLADTVGVYYNYILADMHMFNHENREIDYSLNVDLKHFEIELDRILESTVESGLNDLD